MTINYRPDQGSFAGSLGTALGTAGGQGLNSYLNDMFQKRENKGFAGNLAKSLGLENEESENFVKTFGSLAPIQQLQGLLTQSQSKNQLAQSQEHAFKANQNKNPSNIDLSKKIAQSKSDALGLIQAGDIQHYDQVLKELRDNIDVTDFNYGKGGALGRGLRKLTGTENDPKLTNFNTQGAEAYQIAEKAQGLATGRGLTDSQVKKIQKDWAIDSSLSRGEAQSRINALQQVNDKTKSFIDRAKEVANRYGGNISQVPDDVWENEVIIPNKKDAKEVVSTLLKGPQKSEKQEYDSSKLRQVKKTAAKEGKVLIRLKDGQTGLVPKNELRNYLEKEGAELL